MKLDAMSSAVLRGIYGFNKAGQCWSHQELAGRMGLSVDEVLAIEQNALRFLAGLRAIPVGLLLKH